MRTTRLPYDLSDQELAKHLVEVGDGLWAYSVYVPGVGYAEAQSIKGPRRQAIEALRRHIGRLV